SARPAKIRTIVILPTLRVESGYDGKNAWEIDPATGPALLTGRRQSEMIDEAWFDSALHEPDYVKDMTVVAREKFDMRDCIKLKVTFLSGNEEFQYFDAATGLQAGYEATRETPMGVL